MQLTKFQKICFICEAVWLYLRYGERGATEVLNKRILKQEEALEMTLREIIYQAVRHGNHTAGDIVSAVNKLTDGAYTHGARFIHGALYQMSKGEKWKRRGFNKIRIGARLEYHIGCRDCDYYRMVEANYCGGCGVKL